MKKLVILGAGTAGTMMLNKLHHELDKDEWEITIVDQIRLFPSGCERNIQSY